jgi:hypothetical protein
MSKKTGIWIDHSRAYIVSLENEKEHVSTIESKVGRKVRLSGGSRTKVPYGPQDIAHEGRRYRKYKQQLKSYYEKVCKKVGDTESLYIFGPGEAKTELRKHMEGLKHTAPPIVGMDSADKMTRGQLVARVRDYYRSEAKTPTKT